MGGWERVCSFLIEEEPFKRKEFIEVYEVISKSQRDCPQKLIGTHERNNGTPNEIKMIGGNCGANEILLRRIS
jgi:hypothetical protein